jgi:hypothetical protein
MGHRTSSTDLHGTIPYSFRGHVPTIPRQRGWGRCASRSVSAPQKERSMATCPLTTTELDDVLVTLNRLCPDSPPWRSAPTPASERGVILCGPAGLRVLIETAWNAPERLRISGLFPASPAGDFYPPCAQITPAITVARTRGPARSPPRFCTSSYRRTSRASRRPRRGRAPIATPWPSRRRPSLCSPRSLAVGRGTRRARSALPAQAQRRQPSGGRLRRHWRATSP